MRLTEEQYRALEPYEQNMRTALRSGYARNPGRQVMLVMQDIYNDAAHARNRINTGCGNCILNLLKDIGRIYFADKEERLAAERSRPAEDREKPRIPRVAVERVKGVGNRKKVPVKTKTSR